MPCDYGGGRGVLLSPTLARVLNSTKKTCKVVKTSCSVQALDLVSGAGRENLPLPKLCRHGQRRQKWHRTRALSCTDKELRKKEPEMSQDVSG